MERGDPAITTYPPHLHAISVPMTLPDDVSDFGLNLVLAFIETDDGKALEKFYGGTLGLLVRKKFGETWVEYASGAMRLAVHQQADEASSAGPRLYLSFEVRKLDGLWEHLQSHKIAVSPIRSRDRGRFFVCRDPAGTRLHFISFDKNWKEETGY